MAMRIQLLLPSLLLISATAYAQLYTWKDESGRTVMSDKPPAEKKVKVQKRVAEPAAPVAAAAPKAGAEPEADKKRQAEEAKVKAQNAEKDKVAKAEVDAYCKSARSTLGQLESGERIALRNDKGERSFMEDDQRAAEIARLRKVIAEKCSG